MTNRFTLDILAENAAFEDEPLEEIVRILVVVAGNLRQGAIKGRTIDSNGNVVGEYQARLAH